MGSQSRQESSISRRHPFGHYAINGAIAALDRLAELLAASRITRWGVNTLIATISHVMGEISASEPVTRGTKGSAPCWMR
jgi:hypothetical protein